MKKIPDIINRLWNVCSQMEVGALLTCGSGIKEQYSSKEYSSQCYHKLISNAFVAWNRPNCVAKLIPLRLVVGASLDTGRV